MRADRSEIPIPYLRVGKRDAEVDAPVMYDMGPDVRYGRDVRRNHLHIELTQSVLRGRNAIVEWSGVERTLNQHVMLLLGHRVPKKRLRKCGGYFWFFCLQKGK